MTTNQKLRQGLGNSRSQPSLRRSGSSNGNINRQQQQQQQHSNSSQRRRLHTSQGGRSRGGRIREGSRSSTAIGMSRQQAAAAGRLREFIPIVGATSGSRGRGGGGYGGGQQQHQRAVSRGGGRQGGGGSLRTGSLRKNMGSNQRNNNASSLSSSLSSLARAHSTSKKDRDINGMCRGRPKGILVSPKSRLQGSIKINHSNRGHSNVEAHSLPGVSLAQGRY